LSFTVCGIAVWLEPSAFITMISPFLLKAILLPSGDQSGFSSKLGSLVSGVRPVPSAFITKMLPSVPPLGKAVKAIFVRSGDQAGVRSKSVLFVSRVCFFPAALIT
jgi:hypothetical protein